MVLLVRDSIISLNYCAEIKKEIVSGFINPEILINKIKPGLEIPNLKNSLVKMLCDYSLQVSIQDGCNSILVTDYFDLHEKLTRQQQKAVFLSNDHTCGLCRQDIIVKGK